MNLEPQTYGSTDWHLPSPSSTPKSSTFPEAPLKTPKTEGFPQSHFLDAWATPRLHGQHTPVQTPSFTLSTPIERPSSSYSLKPRTPEDPDFHVNHFAPRNLPLPPVDATRRLSSSPDPSSAAKSGIRLAGHHAPRPRPVTMDFSQMQTPPPTRDAHSRRGVQQSGEHDFTTPATVIQRTPQQMPTGELFNQTPFGFTNSLFSPELMQFPNNAPMSAPPMPQSRLFWDQSTDGSQMDVDMSLGVDPFGPTPHRVEQNFDWQAFPTPTPHQGTSHGFMSHGMSSPGPRAFGTGAFDSSQMSRPGSFVATSTGVDPSMLFSFSNPELEDSSFGIMPPINTHNSFSSRQPYETQARDAHQEKTIARKAKSQHSRSNTNSSSGSAEASRPGLQRSNTDSGFRKSRPSSMESRASAQAAASTIPRRSSPLKRQSGGPLMSIPEVRRPRTRLVIDETGRARTETVLAEEDEASLRETQVQSSKDVRRQYPGLWDDDDTESDEEDIGPTISRNTSFTMPSIQPQRRASKHARADSGGLERSNSFKMPRPSSRTSLRAFDKASFDNARPTRKIADNTHRRFSVMDYPTQEARSVDSQHHDNPSGDALGALKKVVAGRQQKTERASQNTLKAHNQRWAQASAELATTTTPHGHGHYDPFSNAFGASPNATTPSTDRSSLSSESTRCVCNSADDNKPMVQCESCNKWLHMGCVGLNPQNLPPVFVCIYCTGQTPIARGGRVRGPAVLDSPLNHKTMFRR